MKLSSSELKLEIGKRLKEYLPSTRYKLSVSKVPNKSQVEVLFKIDDRWFASAILHLENKVIEPVPFVESSASYRYFIQSLHEVTGFYIK
jgi:hypothetical protein